MSTSQQAIRETARKLALERIARPLNGGERGNGKLRLLEEEAISFPGECETCGGAGFIIPIDPKRPNDIQRSIACPTKCNKDILRQASNLDPSEAPASLDDRYHPSITIAVADIKKRLPQQTGGFILLAGPFGVGKTHILRAVVEEAVELGQTAKIYEAEEILAELRESYQLGGQPGKETESAILGKIERVSVLAIDEIDRISGTPWARGKIFGIMNTRYASSRSYESNRKLTIMTTNLKPEEMDGYLKSRLDDDNSAIFKFWQAPDIRSLRGKDA